MVNPECPICGAEAPEVPGQPLAVAEVIHLCNGCGTLGLLDVDTDRMRWRVSKRNNFTTKED